MGPSRCGSALGHGCGPSVVMLRHVLSFPSTRSWMSHHAAAGCATSATPYGAPRDHTGRRCGREPRAAAASAGRAERQAEEQLRRARRPGRDQTPQRLGEQRDVVRRDGDAAAWPRSRSTTRGSLRGIDPRRAVGPLALDDPDARPSRAASDASSALRRQRPGKLTPSCPARGAPWSSRQRRRRSPARARRRVAAPRPRRRRVELGEEVPRRSRAPRASPRRSSRGRRPPAARRPRAARRPLPAASRSGRGVSDRRREAVRREPPPGVERVVEPRTGAVRRSAPTPDRLQSTRAQTSARRGDGGGKPFADPSATLLPPSTWSLLIAGPILCGA